MKQYGFKTITTFSDIESTQNIRYFKYRASQVNSYVHSHLIKAPNNMIVIDNVKYWPNLELTCKDRFRFGDFTICKITLTLLSQLIKNNS